MAKKTNTSIGDYEYFRIRRKVGMKQNANGVWVPEYKAFYGKSKKEAIAKYEAYIATDSIDSTRALGDLIGEYIDNVFMSGPLKATTKQRYVNAFHLIFDDSKIIGQRVCDLTADSFQDAFNSSPVKVTSKQNALKLLRSFYKYLAGRKVAVDVTGDIDLPAVEHKRHDQSVEVFTQEEIDAFLDRIPQDHRLRLLIVLGIYTGARVAELLALTYSDFQNDSMIINKSLMEVDPIKGTEDKAYVAVSKTKTRTSIRSIPLDPDALKAIEQHKKWHLAEMKDNDYSTDYVFTTASGSLYFKSTVRTAFKRLCKSIGVTPRGFHCFRHTFGSRLASNGVPIQTVSKLMGHSDVSVTTQYYINVPEIEKKEAIKRLMLH